MSSRNAKIVSPASNSAWTDWSAALWPKEKRAGISGSPCSPPSAWVMGWGWPVASCHMYVEGVV